MELPYPLIEQVRERRVVLFLGAGATIGATKPDGTRRVPACRSPELAQEVERHLALPARPLLSLRASVCPLAVGENLLQGGPLPPNRR